MASHPDFEDDEVLRLWDAKQGIWRPAPPPAPRISPWRLVLTLAVLPPLIVLMGAAAWLAWICRQSAFGDDGAVAAVACVVALTAMLRGRMGGIAGALMFAALAGIAGFAWLVGGEAFFSELMR